MGRFLVFTSYIHSQKTIFRQQMAKDHTHKIMTLELSEEDLFANKNGLEWKEKNKELIVNGKYHEVITIKKQGKHVFVSIIEDKLENSLFERFFAAKQGNNSFFNDLVNLLFNLTYLKNDALIAINVFNKSHKNYSVSSEFLIQDFHSELIKPPKFFLV
jgi:hypothetical protein